MNLGQIYTKEVVADFMVDLLDLPENAIIVDPCLGEGVFLRSLQKANYKNLIGIEVDSKVFLKIKRNDFPRCNLINMDFFRYEPKERIEGFILNPPYVRQEEINKMSSLGITKDAIRKKCGDFQMYSKANLYLYFIARCVHLLEKEGRMVAIIPNAWINTPDGKAFYSHLLKKGSVDNLIQVSGQPFVGNPLVEVVILRFTKGKTGKTKEEDLFINDTNLSIVKKMGASMFNLAGCTPLSSIAKIRRGVTTKYNKIFINPPLYDKSVTVDILSSPKNIQGYTTKYAQADKLLSISTKSILSDEIIHYLENAELNILSSGKPKTLLELIRRDKPWYVISLPKKSNIIFPYIIRENMRFILNEQQILARDNFYTISSELDSYLLMALLNNFFVFSQLELLGKSYGNGLLKIQKYDIDNILIPSPASISASDKDLLSKCAKNLIDSNDTKYITESTEILSKYYHIGNIKDVYVSCRQKRLRYEL